MSKELHNKILNEYNYDCILNTYYIPILSSGGGGGGIERCRCFCDTLMSMSEKGRVGVGDLDRLEVRLPYNLKLIV